MVYIFITKENNFVKKFLEKYGLLLAWLVAVFSATLSLYYSDIVGFEACSLCWWQRIFIYPQAIFLGIAYFKKEFRYSSLYAIVLSIIGMLIGIYQNALYYGVPQIGACDSSLTAVSCTKLYILEFGYITIPVMSLTAFLLMIFFLKLQKKN
ncbi:MAG: disulfide bond formation protein DsbB [uncultured bacterium]|nr:MAG: disulfide bond formation protein DsbB [uncultured bacterium]